MKRLRIRRNVRIMMRNAKIKRHNIRIKRLHTEVKYYEIRETMATHMITDLENEKDQNDEKIKGLKILIVEFETQIGIVKSSVSKCERQWLVAGKPRFGYEFEEKINHLQIQIGEYVTELLVAEEKLGSSTIQELVLMEIIRGAYENLASVMDTSHDFEEQINELIMELGMNFFEIKELEQHIKLINSTGDSLEKKIKELKAQIKEKNEEITDLEAVIVALSADTEDLAMDTLNGFMEQIADLNDEASDLRVLAVDRLDAFRAEANNAAS